MKAAAEGKVEEIEELCLAQGTDVRRVNLSKVKSYWVDGCMETSHPPRSFFFENLTFPGNFLKHFNECVTNNYP